MDIGLAFYSCRKKRGLWSVTHVATNSCWADTGNLFLLIFMFDLCPSLSIRRNPYLLLKSNVSIRPFAVKQRILGNDYEGHCVECSWAVVIHFQPLSYIQRVPHLKMHLPHTVSMFLAVSKVAKWERLYATLWSHSSTAGTIK